MFKNFVNKALTSMLAILGFGGCEWFGNESVMYGEPRADYKLLGEVKDGQDKPIEGIRVVFSPNPEQPVSNDTLYSDSNGCFSRDYTMVSLPDEALVMFEDVDSDAHGGTFASKTLDKDGYSVTRVKKGDGSWYQGAFNIKADVTLDRE